MRQRNLFNHLLELYADTGKKISLYAKEHPERVIGGMFLILLVSVAGLLISKAAHRETYSGSIHSISSKFSGTTSTQQMRGRPITADIMNLLTLYGKTRGINPDSLTLKDSLLLKEIDRGLNKILNEKD